MPLPIEDYALIGDCQTAALVGKDGSIDWLCFPRFDSGACFAALLGTPQHGRWLIAPCDEPKRVTRRYREGTLILETEFETDGGVVTIIDFMPPRDEAPDVVRLIVGKRGSVKMKSELIIRFDYGSIVPWVRRTDAGLRAVAGPDTLECCSRVEMRGENLKTVGEFTIAVGERTSFVLTWRRSHESPPPRPDAEEELEATESWWRNWSSQCTYRGPWRKAVIQSLVVLKALTYEHTGGIVAAATTSLPEKIGGPRNWDYRYCWLRDATFALYSLLSNGYSDEASAWRDWLLRAVAGDPAEVNIMYGLAGERRLEELELKWLPGYENSKPVQIGNGAYRQIQLDVYGEVMDLLHQARRLDLAPDENGWRVETAMLGYLETAWREPDNGIWEVRGPRRHFTHSKVMAWLAFDRGIKDVERFDLDGPIDKWKHIREEIHEEVCRNGYDETRNTFVQYYGGAGVDASLLMIPLVNFLPASDRRVQGTIEAIQRHLTSDIFVARYPSDPEVDGLPHGEGAFLICSFWLVDGLLLLGREREAKALFERLLSLRNDVGLLSEELDPASGRFLGNFPQAFSHVGLINSAMNLSHEMGSASHRAQT